jgi:hypothetical protein
MYVRLWLVGTRYAFHNILHGDEGACAAFLSELLEEHACLCIDCLERCAG